MKCFPVPKQIVCKLAHEEYSQCGAHPNCQRTCDNLDGPLICPKICMPGCVCEEGYVKNSDGLCVKPEECPVVTRKCSLISLIFFFNLNFTATCLKAFEYYTDCGTACPITCENKDNPPLFCTANCVVGCFCEDGYVRNSDGECVLPTNCPAPERK